MCQTPLPLSLTCILSPLDITRVTLTLSNTHALNSSRLQKTACEAFWVAWMCWLQYDLPYGQKIHLPNRLSLDPSPPQPPLSSKSLRRFLTFPPCSQLCAFYAEFSGGRHNRSVMLWKSTWGNAFLPKPACQWALRKLYWAWWGNHPIKAGICWSSFPELVSWSGTSLQSPHSVTSPW